jgi:diadenosine tetraphosphate (Ap4A) HIT family hydrolase
MGSNDVTYVADLLASTVFLYRDQFYKGRLLVVYRTHAENFLDLTVDAQSELYRDAILAANVLNAIFKPDLINFAMFGNVIRHTHWHVIPRYRNEKQWGQPPWPHERTFFKQDSDYRGIAAQIRAAIEVVR